MTWKADLLYAKDAIFKLILQFHIPTKMDENSDELYIYNYCESALEAAFDVLGIEDNQIKLMDFCKMWEENDRAIWSMNIPNEPYDGATADIYYDIFKEAYEHYWDRYDEEESEEVRHGKWIMGIDEADYEYGTCSVCGYVEWDAFPRGDTPHYCSGCGAKMDRGGNQCGSV